MYTTFEMAPIYLYTARRYCEINKPDLGAITKQQLLPSLNPILLYPIWSSPSTLFHRLNVLDNI